MAYTKTYVAPTISDPDLIYQSFAIRGFADVIFELNGDLKVTSQIATSADEALFDQAVTDASDGSLLFNKSQRIKEVSSKTILLMDEGVETWEAGDYAELSLLKATEYYSTYRFMAANPDRLTANLPYIVYTLAGRISSTSNIADLEDFSRRASDRISYIISSKLNGDGSKGEIQLISEITTAANQAALDAIIDIRQ